MSEEIDSRFNALYARVSTDDQAREGTSLEEQEERLRAWCRSQGWKDNIRLYIDDGYSAKSLDRPKLKELHKDVRAGKVARVLVTKLDRLSRKLTELLFLIETYEDHNVDFISTSEGFDTGTSSGKLVISILGAVAEFERIRISDRVVDNMLFSAKTAKWLTQPPYGYQINEKKELVIDPEESEIVKRVFHEYLTLGYGYFRIAKGLNDDNVPSKYEKGWSHRTVKLMLLNETYKGTYIWNRSGRKIKKVKSQKDDDVFIRGEVKKEVRYEKDQDEWIVIEDALPAIIDKGTWERVNKKIASNPKRQSQKIVASPHLLGGILKCGKCGAAMSGSFSGSKNKRYRVYRCAANKNKGVCTNKYYKAEEVEGWFKEGLMTLFKDGTRAISLSIKEKYKENIKSEIEQRASSAKARYNRQKEAYAAGIIELDDLKKEKEKYDKALEDLAKANDETKEYNLIDLETIVQNRIKQVVDAIDTMPIEDAKPIVQTLIEKVTVNDMKNINIEFATF